MSTGFMWFTYLLKAKDEYVKNCDSCQRWHTLFPQKKLFASEPGFVKPTFSTTSMVQSYVVHHQPAFCTMVNVVMDQHLDSAQCGVVSLDGIIHHFCNVYLLDSVSESENQGIRENGLIKHVKVAFILEKSVLREIQRIVNCGMKLKCTGSD